MVIPYDTGKVKIGCYYERPRYVEHDRDMLMLQLCLIGDARKARIQYWINVSYLTAVAFIFLVMIFKR